MDTEALHSSDTPHHSSSTASQGQNSTQFLNIQYFLKHDTVKLSEQNYLLWKHQILLILQGYELEGYVLGTISVPSPLIPRPDGQSIINPSFLLYKKQDKFLASWLLSTVTDEILVHLTMAKTSFEVWTVIERRFGVKFTVKIFSMRHALYSVKKANLTVKEYLAKVKTLCDSLITAGSPISKQEQEYKPSHRGHGRGWSLGRGRVSGRGWSRSKPQCQLCGKIGHLGSTPTNKYQLIVISFKIRMALLHAFVLINATHVGSLLLDLNSLQILIKAGTSHVSMGNGDPVSIANVGSVSLLAGSRLLGLQNVLHVPNVCKNLLSVGQFARDNAVYFEFHPFLCYVKDIKTKKTLLMGHMHDVFTGSTCPAHLLHHLLRLHNPPRRSWVQLDFPLRLICGTKDLGTLVPMCLGLLCKIVIFHLLEKNMLNVCSACQLGKAHKLPFKASSIVYSTASELVESDVWGLSHFGGSIKMLQSDWGGEYRLFSRELVRFGIQHKVTCPHTSEQNRAVERKHCQIVDMGLTLLAQAGLLLEFWSYAFAHAVHLINRLPTPVLKQQSPYEMLYKVKPSYSHFKVFGCACYPCLRHYHPNKLQFQSSLCVFLGIGLNHKGYQCLDKHGRTYKELGLLAHKERSLSAHEDGVGQSQSRVDSLVQQSASRFSCSLTSGTCLSSPFRQVHPSANTHSMQTRSKSGIFKPKLFTSAFTDQEPTSIVETFQSPVWTAAAHVEYTALLANHTWDIVPLPAGRKTVGCKWIFKVKQNADGSVVRYKGRLVVKGYLQEASVNFWDTFSPIVKPTTIRVVLALAVSIGWSLRQVDINNAFLNSDLQEEIYMVNHQDQFVQKLDDQFSLKDFGRLSYFLGIEVQYTTTGLFLSQRKYILDLLRRASMEGSIVGALQYVVITRPDIAFAVNKVCQFMHNPLDVHFKAVKRVLGYLHGTLDHGLHFTKSSKLLLEGFSDVSWGSDINDRRSTSGYCVFLGGSPISWSSRKQQVVSRLTAEAEYRSLAHVTAEMVWIQSLLIELSVSLGDKALVWCDSSAAVAVAGNPVLHSKFKHVELDLFFVREKVAQGLFQVGHVPSQEQVADILTKPLAASFEINFECQPVEL
ncbi:hypothetical protein CXB51_009382 [Gossypium anomalum]|uniref:Integrase catalytic domain-containing protein n=1 Tax=Gossypium anomalum TaxID=47600 RepID=A0A8J6D553_9ROSI|nr:hypothetical protein CXB51_009382 [Gossypium anomalum]